jgi:hypothetical protein
MIIKRQELKTLIEKVVGGLLTSNQIVDRINYPYYWNHESVPHSLTLFKKKLEAIRRNSDTLVVSQPDLFFPNAPDQMCSFSSETFARLFTVALTTSLFGIGDCGECSAKLGLELIKAGFGDLAFVAIKFPAAEVGMETMHSFVIANLPSLRLPSDLGSLSVQDLFAALPPEALIADPFLGLVFSPGHVPDALTNYINAYGRSTSLMQCQHFYKLPKDSKIFASYQAISNIIAKTLRLTHPIFNEHYQLEAKTRIHDTILVSHLKEKTGLSFFGVRDNSYKVDAVVELEAEDREIACKLQEAMGGRGQFFSHVGIERVMYLLEGINLPDSHSGLTQGILGLTKKL